MENTTKIEKLNELIDQYYNYKTQADTIKAEMNSLNNEIKALFEDLEITKHTNPDGVTASIVKSTKYTYREAELVSYLKSLKKDYALKVVPNMDIVKAELKSKALNESIIDAYRTANDVISLTVTKKDA